MTTLKTEAIEYTNLLNPVRYYRGTHDLGFMINCSYGNALRLTTERYNCCSNATKPPITSAADSTKVSVAIRSWDFGTWNFPVIIDNMMNLDLAVHCKQKLTNDDKYKNVAITHANTTMKNHFRPDYTCWHVVSYNNDGTVERKQTFQGKNDDSAWSTRSSDGAVYGYTACFRETNDSTFLELRYVNSSRYDYGPRQNRRCYSLLGL